MLSTMLSASLFGAAALAPDTLTAGIFAAIALALTALASLGILGQVKMQDASLADVSHTMPNGAATTYSSTFDLGIKASSPNDFLAQCELEIVVPNFTTTQLGDTQTITISVMTSDTSDLSTGSPVVLGSFPVYTGAGGAGATGGTLRFRPPTDVLRYIGTRAVKTGASNASTATVTNKLRF